MALVLRPNHEIVRDGVTIGKIGGSPRTWWRGRAIKPSYYLEVNGKKYDLSGYSYFADVRRDLNWLVESAEAGKLLP